MTDQLARLADMLGKRTPGPLSVHQTISGTFQLLDEQGGILGETTHHGKMMHDACAWAAGMNTIDALVKVAEVARRITECVDCRSVMASEHGLQDALAALDASIKENLKT